MEGGNDSSSMRPHHDYILMYAKNIDNFRINLDDKDLSRHISKISEANLVDGIVDEENEGELFQLVNLSKQKDYHVKIKLKNGEIIEWQSYAPQSTIDKWIKIGKIFVGKTKVPYVKSYLKDELEGKKPSNIIEQIHGTTKAGSIEIREIFGNREIFSYPKPVSLIKRILQISTAPGDIILDFFAGSGTTGQAVMELNQEETDKQAKDGLLAEKEAVVGGRKFILVQLPEKIDHKKEAFKAGYKYISDITIERVRRAGEKYKSVDNGFKVLQLTESIINRKFMNTINATKEEIFAEIACSYGYGLNYQCRDLHNLGKGITYLKGNNRQALIILGEEQMNNQTLAEIILYSDNLKECQIFAQDSCLNVEIIHNLYQHFEQKRVVIV